MKVNVKKLSKSDILLLVIGVLIIIGISLAIGYYGVGFVTSVLLVLVWILE